jgi:uncharacterized protein
MSLRDQINDDLKAAMRSGETVRRDTIRLLTDSDVLAVIEKMIKQRRDSISQFEQGGRQDLADKEKLELTLLQTYMPQAMGEDELAAAIAAAVVESGAAGPADMGKVMAVLKPKLAGRADMGKVSAAVKARLTQS